MKSILSFIIISLILVSRLSFAQTTAPTPTPIPLPAGNYILDAADYSFVFVPGATIVFNVPTNSPTPSPTAAPTLAPTPTPPPTPTPTPAPVAHFITLPAKSSLPTEAWCKQQVDARPMPEMISANIPFNATEQIPPPASLVSFHANPQPFKGDTQGVADYQGVSGNFQGPTDMIIRWAACKYGIDEDVIRAEAWNESKWFQRAAGDKKTAQGSCVQPTYPGLKIWDTVVAQPGGSSVTCPLCCFQSWGIVQNKLYYSPTAFPVAVTSTAFNLDFLYAKVRSCMKGNYSTYFSSAAQQPNTYSADIAANGLDRILWGCIGQHFSGGWYNAGASVYINNVKTTLVARPWP